MTHYFRLLISLYLLVCCIFTLPGCTTGPLSGSASMRIEIDVYKGPLSEEPEMQWFAILGQLDEAERSFIGVDNFARAVIANKDFKNVSSGDYSNSSSLPLEWPVPRIRERYNKNQLFETVKLRIDNLNSLTLTQKAELKIELYQILSEFGVETDIFNNNIDKLSIIDVDSNNLNDINIFKAKKRVIKNDLESSLKEDGKLNELCEYLDPEGPWDFLDFFDCIVLISIIDDTKRAVDNISHIKATHPDWFNSSSSSSSSSSSRKSGTFKELDKDEVKVFLGQISRLTISLRDSAFRWSISSIVGQSTNVAVNAALVNFIVASSENGNQLKNRADALLKQMPPNGNDRRELPPSIALRETEPTDFINLYKWLNVTAPSFLSSAQVDSVGGRIKMVERLISDQYWSKINTVYASGRGKVSMAFIKDEVGNWNLKSFDNDPAELLHAYTTLSLEALKKAAELVAAGSSGGGSAAGELVISQLIAVANESSFNSPSTSKYSELPGLITGIHSSLIIQLSAKEAELDNSSEDQRKEILKDIKIILIQHQTLISGLAKGLIYQSNQKNDDFQQKLIEKDGVLKGIAAKLKAD